MIYNLFSVKDVVSGNFSNIEIFVNDEVAKRWFSGLCQESKIANDLQLFKLGTYNAETGEIVPHIEYIVGGASVNG